MLGASVTRVVPVHGGDIHSAHRVELRDGRSVFVKSSEHPPPRLFEREAEGLRWLAEARALRIPDVLAYEDGPLGFLALRWIEAAPRSAGFDEALGRGLAALHRAGAPSFGHRTGNYLATLPQDNTPSSDWASFYVERRLEPLLARAVDRGLASARMRSSFARLFARIAELVGPEEPPARLHGDLWSGNLLVDEHGAPVLIDPAVYGGHREVDLAMMRLFGGFSPRCFAAYAESHPLPAGREDRVPLYQLLPLLVHVVLFGGSYVAAVESALARLLGGASRWPIRAIPLTGKVGWLGSASSRQKVPER